MDRQAIARTVRRRHVQEMLEYEQEREQTLTEQIEVVIGDALGGSVDEAAFARMAPEHAEIVRKELSPPAFVSEDADDFFGFDRDEILDDDPWDFEEPVDSTEDELTRLNGELEDCRRRQVAYAAYLQALDEESAAPPEP